MVYLSWEFRGRSGPCRSFNVLILYKRNLNLKEVKYLFQGFVVPSNSWDLNLDNMRQIPVPFLLHSCLLMNTFKQNVPLWLHSLSDLSWPVGSSFQGGVDTNKLVYVIFCKLKHGAIRPVSIRGNYKFIYLLKFILDGIIISAFLR